MELKTFLIAGYIVLGLLNVYCYLFQRTTKKLRSFAVGTTDMKIQNKFYPSWYYILMAISLLRYVALVWLATIDWKIALILFAIIGLLKLVLPVNDYSNIQKIKKHFERKIDSTIISDEEMQLYKIVLMAEKETL